MHIIFLLLFLGISQVLAAQEPQTKFQAQNHQELNKSENNQSANASSTKQDTKQAGKTKEEPKEQTEQLKQTEESNKTASPHKLTAAVTFVSDYRSRGISQTMRRPAVQGELKYTHESGFYLRTFASNVDGTGNYINNTSLEWDFYIGFQHKLWETPLSYNVGFEIYYYPGGEAPVPRGVGYDTVEYYIGFIYKNFSIKLYQTLTDYFGVNSHNPPTNWDKNRPIRPNGHSRGSLYVEADLDFDPDPKWKISFHAGYQSVTNYPQLSYFDWQVAVTYLFPWFEFSLFYIGTNARPAFYDVPDHAFHSHRRRLGAPGSVIAISRNF